MPVGRLVARALAGAAGTQLGLRLAPRTRRTLGPVEVGACVALGRTGGVRVDVAPLGTVLLRTHGAPLQVHAAATALDPSAAEGLLRMPADDADAADVRAQLRTVLDAVGRDARGLGAALAVRSVLAGLGGAAALAAVGLRTRRDVAGATAASALGLLGAVAASAVTLDRDAWREPELTGLLTRAPVLLGDLREAPGRIGVYRDQLADLIRTGTGVYRRVATLPEPPPQQAVRLLHISDIHLSPVAFGLTAALVAEYRVDAVVDTGDLVDWGTPAENAFAAQIGALGVPYVYVKGNHDSTGIAAAVARQPGATVLTVDSGPVEIAGLTFAGMADPRFTPDKTTGDDRAHHRVAEAATQFAENLRADGRHVDIALVHSPAAARALEGLVPLVLAGDIHRRRAERRGDTTVLVQGSTGGSGLRGVQQEPPTPFMLSVLYVDRTSRRVTVVDEITLGGLGHTELSVVRRGIDELLGDAARLGG